MIQILQLYVHTNGQKLDFTFTPLPTGQVGDFGLLTTFIEYFSNLHTAK